jgi:hypothetical protein
MSGEISRLVLAIMSKDTRETLERWQFDVKMETPPTPNPEDSFVQPFLVLSRYTTVLFYPNHQLTLPLPGLLRNVFDYLST